MTIEITIIGLNQVGASIGLALGASGKGFYRVGYDRDVKTGQQAVKDKAVDKSAFNLPAAVEKSDFVVLSVPAGELKTAMQVVGPALKAGAVVVDASPLKTAGAEWAAEFIPAGRWYVSISPTLNPDFFHQTSPDAGLFKNSLMVITARKGTPEEVVDNVIGLADIMGARTQFSDPLEHDGLTAGVHQLPVIAAAALMHAVSGQPGWVESRKVAGAGFANASAPLQPLAGQESPSEGLFLNRENALRVLDNLSSSLEELRSLISDGRREETDMFLEQAAAERQTWMEQRRTGDWEKRTETPSPPGPFSRLLGMGGKSTRK